MKNNLLLLLCLSLSTISTVYSTTSATSCGEGEFLYTRSYRRRRVGGRKSCRPCVAGQYKTFTQHTDSYCDKCESGRYQDQTGQANCIGTKCSAGQFGLSGQTSDSGTSCSDCSPGRFSTSLGHESCGSCPSGLYSSQSAATSCLGNQMCPPGKWGTAYATQPTSCLECPTGKYQDRNGLFECKACPPGKYQPLNTQSHCLDEPSCPRWNYFDLSIATCREIYDSDKYILLLGLSWTNFLLSAGLVCCMCRYIDPNECTPALSPLFAIISFSVSVWLSVPHPANISRGMNHAQYLCLLIYIGGNIIASLYTILYPYLVCPCRSVQPDNLNSVPNDSSSASKVAVPQAVVANV